MHRRNGNTSLVKINERMNELLNKRVRTYDIQTEN